MSIHGFEPISARILPVVLLLDTSGSMAEEAKIDVLNEGVQEMIRELRAADAGQGFIALTVITFGGTEAKVIERNVKVRDLKLEPLGASGPTPLGHALRIAQALLEDHDEMPSSGYTPTVALVSDGQPNDRGWEQSLADFVASKRVQKSSRFALAIGADADRKVLSRFAGADPHEAEEAAAIRQFLQFVTMTVTRSTRSIGADDAWPSSS
jgi:uncharacterized protein YegL